MSKKIIFIGPPSAGKTTLRKVFFEGESSTKLLEYAIQPTYGEESLILRLPGLNQDVGIFDLAGQENERWLETEEKSIFIETKLILIVIDITSNSEESVEFIKKLVDLRNEVTPLAYIFVLLHKIDLVSEKKIREYKLIINNEFADVDQAEFLFTSLKREYFPQTFSYFINIMKVCLEDIIPNEGLLLNMVDESLKIIQQIDKKVLLSKNDLFEILNRPEKLVNYLIDSLLSKGHIEITSLENKELLSLTNKGKMLFNKILNDFSSNTFDSTEKHPVSIDSTREKKVPSIIGAIIANKDGVSLLNIELFNNALNKFIAQAVPKDSTTIPVDLELIPMFISALEKFSLELNIQDLTGFGLKGSNLKMHIFGYEDYTVTVFMNPNINLNAIKYKINNYFANMFEEHSEEFEVALKTGRIDELLPIKEIGKNWLIELNESYQNMVFSSEIIDKENAQDLYNNIDVLYEDIKKEFAITLEKVKKLKVSIVKSIIEKDYNE
ncbi:MAG: ADP-ribosylation factor-like protein, partial [Promethearchaeota archaeon]